MLITKLFKCSKCGNVTCLPVKTCFEAYCTKCKGKLIELSDDFEIDSLLVEDESASTNNANSDQK